MADINELNARRDAINDQIAALVAEKKQVAAEIDGILTVRQAEALLVGKSPGQVDAIAHAAAVILKTQPQEPTQT